MAYDFFALGTPIPAVEDSNWPTIAAPLLAHIECSFEGLSTKAILALWRKRDRSGTKTRNMLAWLAFQNLVVFDQDNKVWTRVANVNRRAS